MAEAVTCQEALYYKKDEELDSLVNAISPPVGLDHQSVLLSNQ